MKRTLVRKGNTNLNEYPTMDAVKSAEPQQIRNWYDRLPAPSGEEQIAIMKQIIKLNKTVRNKP